MRGIIRTVLIAVVLAAASSAAAAQSFDPKPWLDDLAQAKDAFATKYANLEWAQFDTEERLSDLFAQTETRVRRAGSDADARAAFDRLARRLGDGHVEFDWPEPPRATSAVASVSAPDVCGDYDTSRAAPPLAGAAVGYRALHTPQSDVFPAGLIAVGARRVGVVKIGMFGPHATPAYCHAATAALHIPEDKPCDDDCEDRIDHWASVRMTEDFAAQIRALKAAGADVLLVDIAGNGGGSQWAETAARTVTPLRISAEPVGFVRGPHWTKSLGALELKLREFARQAPEDRAELERLAD
jgi:hypothetical protein